MIEKTFSDRVPTYPGRVKLVPVVGQENTYDMERADEPRVAGTPLNKATFDSVVQSRLTGRYYAPTLSRNIFSSQTGLTASPIPTAGWVEDPSTTKKATNGSYAVEVSSDQAAYGYGYEAFSSSGWESLSAPESWIQIYHSQPIKVRAMSFRLEIDYPSRLISMDIQGSTNGSSWITLYSLTDLTEGSVMTYNLPTTGEYTYYRIYFRSDSANGITLSNWKYTLYDINTYVNAFNVASGFPSKWDVGQRVMISTPSTISSFAVVANTLNGATISTILQANRRYELRYTGSAFAVKEV